MDPVGLDPFGRNAAGPLKGYMAKSQNSQKQAKPSKTKQKQAKTSKTDKKTGPLKTVKHLLKLNENADLGGPGDGGGFSDLAV